ncbi:hypothetical protein [Pseudobythopirellula maris]|uniref:hypothetical protein n=1 Tax=Pseudobythopirellula maris TaxID=2527991 RepID=UPI0011B5D949|nr:hypothetical protein [Pseudobythopirellula maris]
MAAEVRADEAPRLNGLLGGEPNELGVGGDALAAALRLGDVAGLVSAADEPEGLRSVLGGLFAEDAGVESNGLSLKRLASLDAWVCEEAAPMAAEGACPADGEAGGLSNK